MVYYANEKKDLYECALFLCLFVAFKKTLLAFILLIQAEKTL